MKKTVKKRYIKKKRSNKKTWKKRGGMFTARVLKAVNPYIEKKAKEFGQGLIEEKLKRSEQFKDFESNVKKNIGNIGNIGNSKNSFFYNKENQNNYNFSKSVIPYNILQTGVNKDALNYAKNSVKINI